MPRFERLLVRAKNNVLAARIRSSVEYGFFLTQGAKTCFIAGKSKFVHTYINFVL